MRRSRFPAVFFVCAWAAAATPPQAASRQELDAFGAAMDAGDSLARIRACEAFLARYPHSQFLEKALELEFDAFRQRGDRAALERIGPRILALDHKNARILADLAQSELADDRAAAGRHASEALAALDELLRPEDMDRAEWIAYKHDIAASVHLTRGLLALGDRNYVVAANELRQSVAIHPDHAEWQHDLGLALLEAKQPEEAVAAFQRAHELKPDMRGTLLFLGVAELRLGRFSEAARDLNGAVELEPGQREAWLNLLRAKQALGIIDEDEARRAAERFPNDSDIQFEIAEAALDQIHEIARRVNELGPDSADFRALLARKHGTGIANSSSAMIATYDRLANLVNSCFESVLRLSPDSRSAHIAKGYLEESKNDVDVALAEYRAGGDHFAAGRLLAQNSRLPEAEQEFQAELAVSPSNHLAMADLAEVYIQQNEAEKAKPLLEALTRMYPQDPWAWLDLGKAQQEQDDWEVSAASFERALSLDPSLPQAHYRLAASYRKAGQMDKAAAELDAFRKTEKSPH